MQLPTGSGKSEIAASIIRTYLNYYFNRAVVYVVPTIKLQKEAKERFESYSIPCNTELPFVIGCANIITYASMVRTEIKTTDKDKVGALIFDESHHLKGAKSSKIIHQYKKLNMCIGLSATIAIKLSEKKYLNQLTDEDLNILGCVGYPLYIKEIEETANPGDEFFYNRRFKFVKVADALALAGKVQSMQQDGTFKQRPEGRQDGDENDAADNGRGSFKRFN